MHFFPLLYAATHAVLHCGMEMEMEMEITIAFIYVCMRAGGSYTRVKPFAGR